MQHAIEVSYSSLSYDLDTERRLYAETGLQKYWTVDAQTSCVHVHREPRDGDYKQRLVKTAEHTLSPLTQPYPVLNLSELFCTPCDRAVQGIEPDATGVERLPLCKTSSPNCS